MDKGFTVLPSSVLAACDAEAQVWATETDLNAWISKMVHTPSSQRQLRKIALQCFSEGVYRGAMNVIDGKSLYSSIQEAQEKTREAANDE